ncbi:hypothetical protein RRG08_056820 [Elysia crispata]|uniref:Uncharacterized protein n=1 Tax=Elysia crispata TaxID=231223 RepID=A0AAE1ABH3_9GAST|nr:hypothetical protein RRG08_056820 [Elysia crispata]
MHTHDPDAVDIDDPKINPGCRLPVAAKYFHQDMSHSHGWLQSTSTKTCLRATSGSMAEEYEKLKEAACVTVSSVVSLAAVRTGLVAMPFRQGLFYPVGGHDRSFQFLLDQQERLRQKDIETVKSDISWNLLIRFPSGFTLKDYILYQPGKVAPQLANTRLAWEKPEWEEQKTNPKTYAGAFVLNGELSVRAFTCPVYPCAGETWRLESVYDYDSGVRGVGKTGVAMLSLDRNRRKIEFSVQVTSVACNAVSL